MINTEKLGFIGLITSVAAIGYVCYLHSRVNKVKDIIQTSVDDIAKEVKVDISEIIINQAVERAVEREVKKAVEEISYTVIKNVNRELKDKVKNTVDSCYSDNMARKSQETILKIGM